MPELLEKLRGGLVASCQPSDGGPLDRPEIVAAMAQAAVVGGAAGLRIEGIENLRAVRPLVGVPIIGIVKSDSDSTPVRITVSMDDVAALIEGGADIVAYDATDRARYHSRDEILDSILKGGAIAMADCSTLKDAQEAKSGGATILGTTLSGYTHETLNSDGKPNIALVQEFSGLGSFVMAEGRYNTPELGAAAMSAGADCVTVGSALTRLEYMTTCFADALKDIRR